MNAMVLAGLVLALGIVVDDAIVDVEHITQRVRQNREAASPLSTGDVILDASAEVRVRFLRDAGHLLATVPFLFFGDDRCLVASVGRFLRAGGAGGNACARLSGRL
jgi:hypothetical protein